MRQLRQIINPLAIWLTALLVPFQSVSATGCSCHGKPTDGTPATSKCCGCEDTPIAAGCCCSRACACRHSSDSTVQSRIVEVRRDTELDSSPSESSFDGYAVIVNSIGVHSSLEGRVIQVGGDRNPCALLCRFLL